MNPCMEIELHSRPEGIHGDRAFWSRIRPGKFEELLEWLWKA